MQVLMLESGAKAGLCLILELTPFDVTIGYTHEEEGTELHAAVSACYEPRHMPLISAFLHEMNAQRAVPVLAIYEDTVQIVLSVSPVTSTCIRALQDFFGYEIERLDELGTIKLVSMADADQEDEFFKVFTRCYESDGFIWLNFAVADSADSVQPLNFARATVQKLEREFQLV